MLAASTLAARVRDFGVQAGEGMRRSELDTFVDDVQRAAELLMRNLDKSAKLISSFKEVASDQSASPRSRFELAQLVEDVRFMLAPWLKQRQVTLQLAVAAGIELDTFPAALGQVLDQLVRNAALHGCGEADGTVWIDANDGGGNDALLELCVRDNGSGIAPAHLDKIFDPFFTTKLGHGSCGLGLNIVHNLVSNVLGGSIRALSVPGDTRFILTLPRQAPQLLGSATPGDAAHA